MTRDKRRSVASAIVDALIDAGHLVENESCRLESFRVVSGKLAEIERCGTPIEYPVTDWCVWQGPH